MTAHDDVIAVALELADREKAQAVARAEAAEAALRAGIEAFRLTREYVGEDLLPAEPGWSWFDWCEIARTLAKDGT